MSFLLLFLPQSNMHNLIESDRKTRDQHHMVYLALRPKMAAQSLYGRNMKSAPTEITCPSSLLFSHLFHTKSTLQNPHPPISLTTKIQPSCNTCSAQRFVQKHDSKEYMSWTEKREIQKIHHESRHVPPSSHFFQHSKMYKFSFAEQQKKKVSKGIIPCLAVCRKPVYQKRG
jgi:hypothetical protein